jgi:hypothetical protein
MHLPERVYSGCNQLRQLFAPIPFRDDPIQKLYRYSQVLDQCTNPPSCFTIAKEDIPLASQVDPRDRLSRTFPLEVSLPGHSFL